MSYNRTKNAYGIYHIFNRGNDKIAIFGRPEDKDVFRKQLAKSQSENNFRLFAYTLMNNHYHLLYQDVDMQMPSVIGILQENFAKYYSVEHKHTGQVFENPFKSKPVYDRKYFYQLMCYIENNAVDANIVQTYMDYAWNSEISGFSRFNLIDTEFLQYDFKKYYSGTLDQFIRQNHTKKQLCSLEVNRLTDYEAEIAFHNVIRILNLGNVKNLNHISKDVKIDLVQKTYYAGLSVRQISALSKISIRFIRENKGERNYI